MDQNKFLGVYIDNTHNALMEAIKNSIGVATSKQLVEEALNEKVELIKQHEEKIKILQDNVNNLTSENNLLKITIHNLEKEDKNKEHIDTFKTALVQSRARIAELEGQLEQKNNKKSSTKESTESSE